MVDEYLEAVANGGTIQAVSPAPLLRMTLCSPAPGAAKVGAAGIGHGQGIRHVRNGHFKKVAKPQRDPTVAG